MKLKYKTSGEWRKACPREYNYAAVNNLLDILYEETGWVGYKKWTKELCIEDAKNYEIRIDWKKSNGGYVAARRYGWYEECTAHMNMLNKTWTKEECVADALIYERLMDWHKSKGSGYQMAKKYGWFEECTDHMKKGGIKNDPKI